MRLDNSRIKTRIKQKALISLEIQLKSQHNLVPPFETIIFTNKLGGKNAYVSCGQLKLKSYERIRNRNLTVYNIVDYGFKYDLNCKSNSNLLFFVYEKQSVIYLYRIYSYFGLNCEYEIFLYRATPYDYRTRWESILNTVMCNMIL